jgi:hypothetical protein
MADMTLDDFKSLLSSSSSKTVDEGSEKPSRSFEELSKLMQPKAAPTVGLGEDLARSTGSGLGRGLVGAVGLPGDIETLGRYGLNKMGANVDQTSALPTSEDMIHKAESLHPAVKEALGYQPQYAPSRYAKTAAEFIPASLIGPGGWGAKTAGAIGAGVATQGVEDYAKKTPIEGTGTEMALKLAASIPGYKLGTSALGIARAPLAPFAGAINPEAEAMKRLSGTLQEDIAAGGKYGAKATPQEVLASGVETAPAAIAGSRTQKLIQSAGEHAMPEDQGAFSNFAAKAAEDAKANVSSHIDDLFGGKPVLPFDKIDEGILRAKTINSPNYARVMALPEAQAIRAPELNTVIDRLPPNTIKEAIQSLKEHGNDLSTLGIVNGKYNPQNMPLRFWDEVKQTLDTKIQGLKNPITGTITDKGANSRWNSTNTLLKNTLDNAVGEYGVARGAAAEIAGSNTALEMGMKYLTSTNPANINMIEKNIAKLSTEQKKDLAYGMAGAYKSMLESDPKKALGLFTGKGGNIYAARFENAMKPLGKDAASALIGKVNAEALNSNIQAIKPQSTAGQLTSQYFPAATGAAAAAAHLGELITQPMLWTGEPTAILTGLAAYKLGKLYTAKEASVAAKVLELSADPSRMAEFGQLIKSDPNARSFLNKTNEVLKKGARQQVGVGASMNQDEYPRAAGGRIGRATGGKIHVNHDREADLLMTRMEAAKKMEGHNTERLLQKDDSVIAKALAKANKDI